MNKLQLGLCILIEKLMRWSINPRLRSLVIRRLGSSIGSNVRIYEVQMTGLLQGFKNLHIKSSSIISHGCLLDLTGEIIIGTRTTVSPACIFITHQDPGSMIDNKMSKLYKRKIGKIYIGDDVWIGASTTILNGVSIGNETIIGANSLVLNDIP